MRASENVKLKTHKLYTNYIHLHCSSNKKENMCINDRKRLK